MVGIGITTRNRNNILRRNLKRLMQFMPPNSRLVIVDDASVTHVNEATFRFDTQQGIAKAKNKCFELLDGCQHIFLFDDDCYPISDNWWEPYINNPEPHLMYIFDSFSNGQKLSDCTITYYDEHSIGYTHPRGCMLYFDMDIVGHIARMDERFKIWGWEHVNLSDRIFNNHFTTSRYLDVRHSERLIHSMDEHLEIKSTVSKAERMINFNKNMELYNSLKHEKM